MEAKDVRMVIAEYDLTVSEFAGRVGVSVSYISDLMHERTPIGARVAQRIEGVISELKRNPPPSRLDNRRARRG